MEYQNSLYDLSPTSIPSPDPSFSLCSSFGFELQYNLKILVISPRDISILLISKLAWGLL